MEEAKQELLNDALSTLDFIFNLYPDIDWSKRSEYYKAKQLYNKFLSNRNKFEGENRISLEFELMSEEEYKLSELNKTWRFTY
jgi:hypothetical protein